MSIWDDPNIVTDEATYLKLEKRGDGIKGVITDITTKKWDDGSVCPQLTIRRASDGEEIVWTAGQMQAKRQLKDLRPAVGDEITVELIDIEKRAGNRTLKHISVTTTPAAPAPAGAAQPATPAAPAPPTGIDPLAWASLDDARRDLLLRQMGAVGAAVSPAEPPF